jgi:hypothetical protein
MFTMFLLPCDAMTTLPAELPAPPALTISSTEPFIRVPFARARASADPIDAVCFATTSAGVSFCEVAGTTHKPTASKTDAEEINAGDRNTLISILLKVMQTESARWRYDNHSPGQQQIRL